MLAVKAIHCNKCDHTVIPTAGLLSGCLCDPDSPTWIAITNSGRLLHMSHADFKILEDQ
jgi:hypothetical protein